jgi:hypothetical protein
MAGYDHIRGVLDLYIAPYGTAEPDVTTEPTSPWVELGCSEGDQTEDHGVADLVKFYDNCHLGPTAVLLGQQDPMFSFSMISLTLENVARVTLGIGAITTATGVKRLAVKRPTHPTEYAFLARSETDSPYVDGPGQLYIPRGVFDMKLTATRSKTGRAAIALTFHALEDDAQTSGLELGWKTVATS